MILFHHSNVVICYWAKPTVELKQDQGIRHNDDMTEAFVTTTAGQTHSSQLRHPSQARDDRGIHHNYHWAEALVTTESGNEASVTTTTSLGHETIAVFLMGVRKKDIQLWQCLWSWAKVKVIHVGSISSPFFVFVASLFSGTIFERSVIEFYDLTDFGNPLSS